MKYIRKDQTQVTSVLTSMCQLRRRDSIASKKLFMSFPTTENEKNVNNSQK